MSHRIAPSAVLPPTVATIAAVVLGFALPSGASAASATPKPPTPESNTTCWGTVSPAPTVDEPNLLAYQLQCNTPITAFSILVNRRPWTGGVVDDFDPAPIATLVDGSTPDTRTSWTCEGAIPANGFNCNAGAGGSMAAWSWAQGSFDTTDPYCGIPPAKAPHADVKRPAKRRLPLTAQLPALPQADVQLVVSDSTGAEDGPFVLWNKASCQVKKPHKHHRHGRHGK